MKKIFCLLFCLSVLFSACSKKNELHGTFKNTDKDGKQIYILKMQNYDSPFVKADSTTIENGQFTFKLDESKEPSIAYLVTQDNDGQEPLGIPFVYENGQIEVSIDSLTKIKGTPLNERCQALFDRTADNIKKATTSRAAIANSSDSEFQAKELSKINKINESIVNDGYNFVKENIKNKVGEFYLISMLGLFDENKIQELIKEANPEYKKMVENMLNGNRPKSLLGTKFIDVSGNTPQGNKIALSDYIGKNKVVLIDFWASWCGPCRQEMPHVVDAYKRFKDKGFEIVGISLDDDKIAWTKALTVMNMTWPQMSDLKGWKSELGAPYNVSSIPYTLLVDKDGNIVGENLKGEALTQKLEEILK